MPFVSVEEFDKSIGQDKRNIASMEATVLSLESIYGRVVSEGICRSDALYLQQVDPLLLKGIPPNGFTATPSRTHLAIAIEAIDVKKAGLIAAIVAAVAAALYKVYSWISGRGSDTSMIEALGERAAEMEEKVIKSNKELDEQISSAEDPSAAKKTATDSFKELVTAADFQKHCSELTDLLSTPNSKLLKQLEKLSLEIVPKVHDLVKNVVAHYNELADKPSAPSHTTHETIASRSMLDASISSALEYINGELDKLELSNSSVNPANRDSLTTASLASQAYVELQRLANQPSQTASKLKLADVQKMVKDVDYSGMLNKLDILTKRVSHPISDGKVDDLLRTEIKWPEDISSDPEKMKKAQKAFELYRATIQDLATVVGKLYSVVKFAGDKYVAYLMALNAVQIKVGKELRD